MGQKIEEIIKFLRDSVEPLADEFFGDGYRASVHLKDGTFLPCVMFLNVQPTISLAIKRFKEEQSGKGIFNRPVGDNYNEIVKSFVTSGNCVNDYDIEKVEESVFALPKKILTQIRGETTMGYTGFVLKMKDGKTFGFGTSYLTAFFQMPIGYYPNDIVEVINHSYISKSGEVKQHKVPFFDWPEDYDMTVVHKDRPYFDCYIEGL